jgi:hypothetical protein
MLTCLNFQNNRHIFKIIELEIDLIFKIITTN